MVDYDEQHKDQADLLRDKVRTAQAPSDNVENVFELPPRSEVHKDKTTKMKWKVRYPVVRLLALFFILLPVTLLSIYYYNNGEVPKAVNASASKHNGYEQVNVETKDPPNERNHVQSILFQNNSQKSDGANETKASDSTQANKSTDKVNLPVSVTEKVQVPSSNTVKKNAPTTNKGQQYTIQYHRVKANETIYHIALEYYHNKNGIALIKQWNHLNGTDIYAGQVLEIPIK